MTNAQKKCELFVNIEWAMDFQGLKELRTPQPKGTRHMSHHRCPEGSTWLHGRFCIFPPEEVQLRFCRFFPTPSTASCILASYCQVMVVVPTIIKSSQVFGNFIHPLSARTQKPPKCQHAPGWPNLFSPLCHTGTKLQAVVTQKDCLFQNLGTWWTGTRTRSFCRQTTLTSH